MRFYRVEICGRFIERRDAQTAEAIVFERFNAEKCDRSAETVTFWTIPSAGWPCGKKPNGIISNNIPMNSHGRIAR